MNEQKKESINSEKNHVAMIVVVGSIVFLFLICFIFILFGKKLDTLNSVIQRQGIYFENELSQLRQSDVEQKEMISSVQVVTEQKTSDITDSGDESGIALENIWQKKYANEDYGFEIAHPDDWFAEDLLDSGKEAGGGYLKIAKKGFENRGVLFLHINPPAVGFENSTETYNVAVSSEGKVVVLQKEKIQETGDGKESIFVNFEHDSVRYMIIYNFDTEFSSEARDNFDKMISSLIFKK